MRFKKLEDNKIQCTLYEKDLEKLKLNIDNLSYTMQEAKEAFLEIAQKAKEKYSLEVSDNALMIDAIPFDKKLVVVFTWTEQPCVAIDPEVSTFTESKSVDVENNSSRIEKNPVSGLREPFMPIDNLQARIWLEFSEAIKEDCVMEVLKNYLTENFINELIETLTEPVVEGLIRVLFSSVDEVRLRGNYDGIKSDIVRSLYNKDENTSDKKDILKGKNSDVSFPEDALMEALDAEEIFKEFNDRGKDKKESEKPNANYGRKYRYYKAFIEPEMMAALENAVNEGTFKKEFVDKIKSVLEKAERPIVRSIEEEKSKNSDGNGDYRRKLTKKEADKYPMYYAGAANNYNDLKKLTDSIKDWKKDYDSFLYEVDGKYLLILTCPFSKVEEMYEAIKDAAERNDFEFVDPKRIGYIKEHGRAIKETRAVEELKTMYDV